MRKEKTMKYQRKTKEFVEAIMYTRDCPIEGVLEFVKDCTSSGIIIGGVFIKEVGYGVYKYNFETIAKTGLAAFYNGECIVKTKSGEIEIYTKEEFNENFTTPWEYE